jgi:ATP-binding protein involved in chromosome partitioning
MPTSDQLTAALSTVIDPEIRRPVTELGMVKSAVVDADGVARVGIYLTVSGCPMKDTITERVTTAVGALPGVQRVAVELDVMSTEQRQQLQTLLRGDDPVREIPFAKPGSLTKVFAVASGKGGVGKSSVTVNLAAAMAQKGLAVGVLDADIYGFSVPRMLGVQHRPTQVESMIMPPSAHGVKVISIGMFTKDNTPVVWRGPMLHRRCSSSCRRLLGRPRRPAHGPAARHRRRRHLGRPARPERRDPRRHDAAAGRAGGRRARGLDRAADPPAHRRRGREHELPRVPPLRRAHRRLRLRRRPGRREQPVAAPRAPVPLLGQVPIDVRLREGGDSGAPLVLSDPTAAASRTLLAVAESLTGKPRGLAGMSLGLSPARR